MSHVDTVVHGLLFRRAISVLLLAMLVIVVSSCAREEPPPTHYPDADERRGFECRLTRGLGLVRPDHTEHGLSGCDIR